MNPCSGAIYMYMTVIVKQVYWYISQISGERLQDRRSSSFNHYTRRKSISMNIKIRNKFIEIKIVPCCKMQNRSNSLWLHVAKSIGSLKRLK